MPKVFPAPFVVLMGPTEYPSEIKDTIQIGSLFTLFLHAPIKAFAFISETTQINAQTWTQCVSQMNTVEKVISDLFEKNIEQVDKSFKRFFQDDFLKGFICRFILNHVLFSLHNYFKDLNVFFNNVAFSF